jgi:hypothetical protein
MGFDIMSILGGNIGELFKDVIGAFKLSPEKKAEMQAIIDTNSHEIAVKQVELESKMQDAISKEIDAASANIRAEASSGDKFTSRARPSFMYMMLAIMLSNYIIFPLINKPCIEYPEALFWLFGSSVLGYTGARTWEKIALPKK